MIERELDWNLAPKCAFAYEKVGSKCFWQCLINKRTVSVPAPRFETDNRIVWLNGEGVFDPVIHGKENE